MACCVDLAIELREDTADEGDEVRDAVVQVEPAMSQSSTGSLIDTFTSPVAMLTKLAPKVPGNTPGSGMVREMVSQQKVRWKEGDVDLDLTYITPQIIAMGFPSYGAESFYRNPVDEVESFLESRHKGHYKVYNLCSERKYDSKSRFGGSWACYPFDDHHPPMPISLITAFIEDAAGFLSQDKANVVAVHCKAGKSRTGMMICCLLLKVHPTLYPTPEAAMLKYGETRTLDGNGVTIPSQKRYIGYWARMLGGERMQASCIMKITKVRVGNLNHPTGQVLSPFFKIRTGNVVGKGTATVYSSKKVWTPSPTKLEWDTTSRRDRYGMDDKGVTVEGDVKIEFRDARLLGANDKLFRFCLNVGMLQRSMGQRGGAGFTIALGKAEIDQTHKDTQDKKYPRDLVVEVTFAPITSTEFQFADPDGDVITIRKGPHPKTMMYAVNGEPRPPFRAVLLDEDSRDYMLFPDIQKGVSIPYKNRRGILRRLRELANSFEVENNIPSHDTITLRQGDTTVATAPLPCKVPNVLVDFNSMQGFDFTVSGEEATTITNTPLLTSDVLTAGLVTIRKRMLPLRKYILSIQRYADCKVKMPRNARVEAWGMQTGCKDRLLGMAQPLWAKKEGISNAKDPLTGTVSQYMLKATTFTLEVRAVDGTLCKELTYSSADVQPVDDASVNVCGWVITGSEWRAFFATHQGWHPLLLPVPAEACELRVVSGYDTVACERSELGFMECCGVCDMGVTGAGIVSSVGHALQNGVKVVPLALGTSVTVDEALLPFSSGNVQVVGEGAGLEGFVRNQTFPSRYLTSELEHVALFAHVDDVAHLPASLLTALHRDSEVSRPYTVVALTGPRPTPLHPLPPNLLVTPASLPLPRHIHNFLALRIANSYAEADIQLAS